MQEKVDFCFMFEFELNYSCLCCFCVRFFDRLSNFTLSTPESSIIVAFRAMLDLSVLEKEKTHSVELKLEDGAGLIHLLVSICDALPSDGAISDSSSPKRDDVVRKYVRLHFLIMQCFNENIHFCKIM